MPAAALHLIKLSVGTEDTDDLARWQKQRLKETGRLFHRTRMQPKRDAELLAGGSIYWVIRGLVRCRQRLAGFDRILDDEGRPLTLLLLDRKLVLVEPVPHRAFQGWRYLDSARAPRDLTGGAGELPAALAAALRQLGAW
jgi:hypothetical protein